MAALDDEGAADVYAAMRELFGREMSLAEAVVVIRRQHTPPIKGTPTNNTRAGPGRSPPPPASGARGIDRRAPRGTMQARHERRRRRDGTVTKSVRPTPITFRWACPGWARTVPS